SGLSRDDIFITNIVKCRPPANRTPHVSEIETCTSNYLFEQIALVNPELMMLLGGVAAKKMLGVKSITSARGSVIERDGRKYIVVWRCRGALGSIGRYPGVSFTVTSKRGTVMADINHRSITNIRIRWRAPLAVGPGLAMGAVLALLWLGVAAPAIFRAGELSAQ